MVEDFVYKNPPGTISQQARKDLLIFLFKDENKPVIEKPIFVPLAYRVLLAQNKFDELDDKVSKTIIPEYLRLHIE